MTTAPTVVMGWGPITAAVSEALGRTGRAALTSRTVRRYAARRWGPLPVWKYGNGRVYLRLVDLEAWARAELAPVPVGGRRVGAAA